jgi:LmbE family N-acetylglucosaminyl deacetylase
MNCRSVERLDHGEADIRPLVMVVVAHPDDESIWVGGTLLRMRDAGIHLVIVCATGKSNPIRAPEFLAACNRLNATPFLLDHEDGRTSPISEDFQEDLFEIKRKVAAASSDILCVLTHPPHGDEHRHPQHLDCFSLVKSWARQNNLPFGVFSGRLATDMRHVKSSSSSSCVEVFALSPIWTAPIIDLFRGVGNRAAGKSGTNSAPIERLSPNPGYRDDSLKDPARAMRQMSVLDRVLNRISSLRPFWDAVAAMAVQINSDEKRELCALHVSQLSGLEEYLAFGASREFLYLNDIQAVQRLGRFLCSAHLAEVALTNYPSPRNKKRE